jgi:sec-independent protein translocase protein TatA
MLTALFGTLEPADRARRELFLAINTSASRQSGHAAAPKKPCLTLDSLSIERIDMIGDLFDSPWKILIVAAVLIVLFGSTKLPHAARSLGKSMRILKTEIKDLHDDPEPEPAIPVPVPVQVPVPVLAPTPAAEQAQQRIDGLQRQLAELEDQARVSGVANAQQPS